MRHTGLTFSFLLLVALLCVVSVPRVRAEAVPAPKPAFDAANDLPLELYQKLHGALEAFYGIASGSGPKLTKAAARKALEESAKAHQAQLLKALNSAQVIHRELAAMALEFCGDAKAAVEALNKSVVADPDSEVRMAAAGTLSNLKDAGALEALVVALEDKEEAVRSLAVAGLGKLKDNRAVEPLLKVLARDDKPVLRARAAGALGLIKDPATLERLVKALDTEKDSHVLMALAGAVRAIRGQDTPATAGVPDAQEHTGALTALSQEMKAVEEKLRNDRHDRAVQVDQKKIEDQLSQLIEQIEKMQSQSSSSSGQKQKQEGQEKKPGNQDGQKQPSTSPMQDSKLGGSAAKGALNPAEVAGKQDDWARLPPAMREELYQIPGADMPARWKLRISAYYYSLAGEENKDK